MIDEIQELMDRYVLWLKDKTTLRQVTDDWVEITTPHLDRHNDYLQLYVKRERDGSLILSDAGHTIQDLKISGCELKTPRRQDLLQITLNGFGVCLEDDALKVKVTKENFSMQKHNLVQAMLSVNDMFYLSQSTVTSLFLEDVALWLKRCDIRNIPRVKFTGRSGYDHLFDFVIPMSRVRPERILQTITRPDRSKAEQLAFKWLDTKGVRPADSKAYAILNDIEQSPAHSVADALRSYEITPVLWSEREAAREELAA